MLNFFGKNRRPPLPFIKRLIQHASNKKIKVTLEIDNRGSVYQILTTGEQAYGYELSNQKLHYYIAEVRDKIEINFDEISSYVFARVVNSGDNFEYLFSDMSDKIFHVDIDNGRNPKVRSVAKNLTELTGDFQIKELEEANYHFKFCQPIFRIEQCLDYSRVLEFDIQGVLLEHYQQLLKGLFEKNSSSLNIGHFEKEEADSNETTAKHHSIKLTINGKEFKIQIAKTNWFDFSVPKQINRILKELNFDQTMQILHEEDWDEKHALCLLSIGEYETLNRSRVIVEI